MTVPPDTVTASVSNAQINNNARANSDVAAVSEQEETVIAPQSQSNSDQTAFVTQLLAQDGSSSTTSPILVQYEALVALGNVKYKPSNALKPSGRSFGFPFGKILNAAPQPTGQPVAITTVSDNTLLTSTSVTPVNDNLPAPAISSVTNAPVTLPQASGAYVASAARATSQALNTQVELA